jgi:hypothetical protein
LESTRSRRDTVGPDGPGGHQFLNIMAVAYRANRRFGVRSEHQLLELMAAGLALVLEDGHFCLLIVLTNQ